ncbi:Soyasapogenol B glucuronide galactosyltransferase [Spatholobus suberectus]|nr:Soyasapogenol B glucuronide galactosyltransferase [Spatholobus suberectus]
MAMEAQPHNQLNVIFLPFLTPGHMIPMVDTARLFAKHGVSVTIITTPANALTFQKAIDSDLSCGYPIRTKVVPFPAAQVDLPDGVENFKDATSPEMWDKISDGMSVLKDQFELLFQDLKPDCLVTDMFYPWTVESAAKLAIPRLYYYSSSYFSSCATYSIRKHKPHERRVWSLGVYVPSEHRIRLAEHRNWLVNLQLPRPECKLIRCLVLAHGTSARYCTQQFQHDHNRGGPRFVAEIMDEIGKDPIKSSYTGKVRCRVLEYDWL